MASPYKQPLAVAKLKGADKKNPKRYKDAKEAIQPEVGVGDCPGHMSEGAKKVWAEITPTMVVGVLTIADRFSWEALCELIAEFRMAPTEFTGAKYSTMLGFLSRFGMTPADRVKIKVEKKEAPPENPFEAFSVVKGGK